MKKFLQKIGKVGKDVGGHHQPITEADKYKPSLKFMILYGSRPNEAYKIVRDKGM